MECWWNDKFMNSHTSWWNVKSIEWQADEMKSWWNDKLMKLQADEIAKQWQNLFSNAFFQNYFFPFLLTNQSWSFLTKKKFSTKSFNKKEINKEWDVHL